MGKTKVNIVVTILLILINKKVKILSFINKAIDSFIIKLKKEIARLKDKGIIIINKYIVRFYSLTIK